MIVECDVVFPVFFKIIPLLLSQCEVVVGLQSLLKVLKNYFHFQVMRINELEFRNYVILLSNMSCTFSY